MFAPVFFAWLYFHWKIRFETRFFSRLVKSFPCTFCGKILYDCMLQAHSRILYHMCVEYTITYTHVCVYQFAAGTQLQYYIE